MSLRRKILLGVVGIIGLLILAATFWDPPDVGSGDGRVLVLDPLTGKTLHEKAFSGGYVVAVIRADGRIVVADVDSCPTHKGGALSTWDATLSTRLSTRSLDPCVVAKLDPKALLQRLGETGLGIGPTYSKNGVSVPLDHGKIVEHLVRRGPESWYAGLTAYDGAGKVIWTRAFPGKRLGIVEARNGTVIVPVNGKFTPGTD